MATIQEVNGIQLNYNGASLPNAGTRILSFGKAVPGTSTWTTLVKFTLISGAASNFGLSIRFYAGAERQSGNISENFWYCQYAGYNSNGTTWTNNFISSPWSFEGNNIISYNISTSGTYVQVESLQADTGVYVEGYCEVYCSKWDQLTISY
jgi:hypothetical protein